MLKSEVIILGIVFGMVAWMTIPRIPIKSPIDLVPITRH
jgi:hypothetical protein